MNEFQLQYIQSRGLRAAIRLVPGLKDRRQVSSGGSPLDLCMGGRGFSSWPDQQAEA